jgi:very-short-patch-repair endonuclease
VISTDKKQMKLQNAIKRISKITGIEHYKDAICLVEESLSRTGWYQSTEEIMVALELIRRNVKAFHQVKIFDYSVDFLLPEMRVALEIDGKIYHGKDRQKYESIRDEVITNKLGEGWEMIRITTDNINKNVTKLIPGINAVLKSRKLQRG